MLKIKKLTPEQEQQLIDYQKEWLDLGRSTEPIDIVEAEQAVENVYKLIDKPKPIIIHCLSPYQLAVMPYIYKALGKCDLTQLETQLVTQLGTQLWTQLETQLRTQLETQLGTQLRTQLETQLGTQLRTQLETQLGTQLGTQLWTQLETQLGTQLRTQLGTQLETQLRTQLGTQLRTQLRTQLETQLGTQLWTQLRTQLGTQLRTQLETQLRTQLETQNANEYHNWWTHYGSMSLYWLAYYNFPYKFIDGFKYNKKEQAELDAWTRLAKSVAGFEAFDGICFISDRPTKLAVDAQGRLHSETGPAIEYADSYSLTAWHGVLLTNKEFIVDSPEKITIGLIESESNAEVKRIMMERYGWGRYLKDTQAELVDEYKDQLGHPVKLWKKELGDKFLEPLVMVELVNSTIEGLYTPAGVFVPDLKDDKEYRKHYMFAVPSTIKSAKAAHIWHCGGDPDLYDEVEFVEQS